VSGAPDTPVPGGLRLALIGSRGIPARYGGYETLLEELATRLQARGHQVSVYCRSHYSDGARELAGVRLIRLPTLRTKHLDTPVHTLLSSVHAVFQGYDAALVVNGINAVFVPLLRLAGVPTALHVDGIERQRAKWRLLGRSAYALSERLACRVPSALVTDAAVIRDYYRERYRAESWLITYGSDPRPPSETGLLERLGLAPGRYFLYVSRFEPENNPHRVIEAYASVSGDLPLVMVGHAPYARSFIAGLRRGSDRRVLFPGAVYGDGYRELMSHALAYVHATEVGGTHPALLAAMGHGRCCLVNDVPENREAAGETALLFQAREPLTLAAALERVLADPELAAERGRAAARRAREHYSWDAVALEYERLFARLAKRGLVEPD
jgi:glycosyltransferase involved in cell wall biosynthesis